MDHYLALCDTKKAYSLKLGNFLKRQGKFPMEIKAFDKEEKWVAFMSDQKASIVLIEERMKTSVKDQMADLTIILTEDKDRGSLEIEGRVYHCIYRYQSAESIQKKLLSIMTMENDENFLFYGKNALQARDSMVLGVYTPIGRSLQTSFSLILSRLLSKKKKTLYLNFEVFPGFKAWAQCRYESSLLDLLFFIGDSDEKFYMKLSSMVEKFGGIEFIPPSISYEDFMLISAADWLRLLQRIKTLGGYEVIVLDLSDQMQGLVSILDICDRIYTICKADRLATAKISDFEEMIAISGKEQVLQKIKKCRLPVFHEMPQQIDMLTHSQLAEYMKQNILPELEDA